MEQHRSQGHRGDDPNSKNEEIETILSGYALGTLEPTEMLAVERWIAESPRLQARLAEIETVVDHIGLAAPEAAPPASIKQGLMERIQVEREARSMESLIADADSVTVIPSPEESAKPGLLRRWFYPNAWTFMTAAAAAAAVIMIINTALLESRLAPLEREVADTRAAIVELEESSTRLSDENRMLREELQNERGQLALLAQPQSLARLAGSGIPNASASFYGGDSHGLLVIAGLPPLPESQTYQLWLIRDGEDPIPSGLIEVDADGSTIFPVTYTGSPSDFAAVAISVEPAGGSPQPTSEPILVGTIS